MALTDKLTAIANAIRTQSGKTAKLTLDQMPTEIINLNALNFEVVGGTAQPSNPVENTIWVNTNIDVTGWHFGTEDISGRFDTSNAVNATNVVSGVSNGVISFNGDLSAMWSSTYIAKARLIAGVTYVLSANLGYGRVSVAKTPAGAVDGTIDFVERISAGSVLNAKKQSVEITPTVTTDYYLRFCTDSVGVDGTKPAFSTAFSLYPKGNPVWFPTGTSISVDFNALKKNGIQVCPLSAKQYYGGAWIDRTAQIYKNGAWADLTSEITIFDNGNLGASGGFRKSGSGTLDVGTTIVINSPANSGETYFFANNPVDLTSFSTITFTFECDSVWDSGEYNARMGVSENGNSIDAYVTLAESEENTRVTKTLDVSALSGAYYVGGVCMAKSDWANKLTVYYTKVK